MTTYILQVCGMEEVPIDYEVHTEPPCDGVGFQCTRGGDCIPMSWQCDGDYDCKDGSDETTACDNDDDDSSAPEVYTCPNGDVINAAWLCDGDGDCDDRADEKNCAALSCLSFECPNGDCISDAWRCDAQNDCGDMADEMDCPQK